MLLIDAALARRLEIAAAWRSVEYARAVQRLHPESDAAVLAVSGGFAVYSGPAFPVNRATGLGMDGPLARADLDRVEHFFRRRGVRPRVDVCPLADPSLLQLLRAGGYRLERFFSVLVRDIGGDAAVEPVVPGIQVTVAGPEERDLWLHTVAQGFDGRDVPTSGTLAILEPNFEGRTATCFLARLGGEPVGGGAMVTHEAVAEFCSASTRAAFRRRGVQTALLRARLAAAREAGCALGMVITAPGTTSQHNVERAGFRLAYSRPLLVAEE